MTMRRFSRNAAAGVAQVVVTAALMFELYRFLVRELGAAQIGVWSLVIASASVARLAEFGFGGGIVRFVAGDLGASNPGRAAATAGMATRVIALAVGLACLLAALVLPWALSRVVTGEGLLPLALQLVPWALAGLVCASVANIFLCVLDASQRTTWRATVMVGAGALQLGAAYLLVPTRGLASLGPVYLIQSGATLIIAILLAVIALRQPLRQWLVLDRPRMEELLRYGGNLQLASVGQLLFDPITKVFMSHFGGMAATGYFEMANRAITQCRAVIVAGYQALVPYLANRAGHVGLTPDEVRSAYLPAYRLLFMGGTPYFSTLATLLPLLLTLWLGFYDLQFQIIGLICLAGWYANTLTVPAYMLWLAVGRADWVMRSHVVIGVLNVGLSWAGGALFGAMGVAAGAMIALSVGSWVMQLALHRAYGIRSVEALPEASAPLMTACACAAGWGAWLALSQRMAESPMWAGLGATAAVLACGALIVRHPFAKDLIVRARASV